MSQKLWVEVETAEAVYGPAKVSIEGCELVDDFLKEIKNEFSLTAYDTCDLKLYKPGAIAEIERTDTMTSLQLEDDENYENYIFVVRIIERVTAPKKKKRSFEEEVLARLDRLAICMQPIVSDFVRRYHYTNDTTTKNEQRDSKFKDKLIEFYFAKHWANPSIKCMLTEIELPTQTVIATHLFKSCWSNDCKERLDFHDINTPRNGILWFEPLAYAFNNSHICYHFNVETETFHMRILDSRLRELTFRQYIEVEQEMMNSNILLRTRDQWQTEFKNNPHVTQEYIDENLIPAVDNLLGLLDKPFSELEGKTLMKAERKCFARCLSFQASMARLLATENGWITKEESDSVGMFSDVEEKKRLQLYSWMQDVKPSSETVPQ